MPQDYSWIFFDTAIFSNVASVTHSLFQVGVGADATHTKSFTNMNGSGSIPEKQKFTIRKIMCTFADQLSVADLFAGWDGAYISLFITDLEYFRLPLTVTAYNDGYIGEFKQTTAADAAVMGKMGQGYMLNPTIELGGGNQFRIEVFQQNALSVADARLRVMMEGILNR